MLAKVGMIETKKYRACGIIKPVSEFHKHGYTPVQKTPQYHHKCKECRNKEFQEKYRSDSKFRKQARRQDNINFKERYANPEFKDHYRKKSRDYYHNNPEQAEKHLKRRYAWNKTPKGKQFARKHYAKRMARKNAIICTLTLDDWRNLLIEFNNSCAYCHIPFSESNPPTQDHVVPLCKGGNHTKENIVPACKSCNSKKHDKIWKVTR